MTGRRRYAELRAGMSPEARGKAEAEARRLDEDMDNAEVRRAMELSQLEIAQILQIERAAAVTIEQRADLYVTTLRRFIEAIGGELEIVARFPDHAVTIRSFSDLLEDASSEAVVS